MTGIYPFTVSDLTVVCGFFVQGWRRLTRVWTHGLQLWRKVSMNRVRNGFTNLYPTPNIPRNLLELLTHCPNNVTVVAFTTY